MALGVVGLAPLDERRDLALEDVGDGPAVAPDRIGIPNALRTVGVADTTSDELECPDFAVRALSERVTGRGIRETSVSIFAMRDIAFPPALFLAG